MKWWKRILLVLAYLLASPFLAVVLWRRGLRYWTVLQLAVTPAIHCYHCGARISLVGVFECRGCGYTFRGHLLQPCAICGYAKIPRVARCGQCRVTTKLR